MAPLRIVLVAGEGAGAQLLRRLLASGHEVIRVLVEAPTSAGASATPWQVARVAGLPQGTLTEALAPGFPSWLREERADLLLNVHALVILPQAVVEAPRLGSYNLHPGPLPELAGLNAPSWAVYEGRTSHAVTLHRMTAGVDEGAIAYATGFPLSEEDTGLSVSLRCAREGLPLVELLLRCAAEDPAAIPVLAQDLALRRWHGRAAPEGGCLRWSRQAAELARLVRACDYGPFDSPWGRPRARRAGEEVEILRARPTRAPACGPPGSVRLSGDGGVTVATADHGLEVLSIRYRGRVLEPGALLADGERLDDGR
jgi:UDP-4-amino-4-deoxy-L-arabinose formyltransferase/UDP-glucuronic acid dehydrogenase (UDP-4-keto-hexauronic acid decarboxylating)